MNKLEKMLSKSQWVKTGNAFTTVYKGFGFVLYLRDGMKLAGLSKGVTANQLRVHSTKPPEITGFWAQNYHSYTERMFEVEVSNEFVGEVLASAFPELK